MKTVQVSIGELVEALYDEMMETYGDRELALITAQALADDLLAEARNPRAARSDAPGALRRDRPRATRQAAA
jgi:hypothetical protein